MTQNKLNEQIERWNERFICVLNRLDSDQPVTLQPVEERKIKGDNIKKQKTRKLIKILVLNEWNNTLGFEIWSRKDIRIPVETTK